jgi:trehalose 6-phosphate phosphatase
MLPILNFANRSILKRLTDSSVMLVFDFDGALSPIIDDRNAAAMRAETATLLNLVCSEYPVAVISGRSRDDLLSRLSGCQVKYALGNHGLEPSHDLDLLAQDVESAAPFLAAALHAGNQGVEIENKRYSIAVHYRRARNRGLALRSIERAVAALPQDMRAVPGELAVNVIPRRARSKTEALTELCVREAAPDAIFVGCGVTDDDVFSSYLAPPGLPSYFSPRITAIHVGPNVADANFFLRNQGEMDGLLEWLYALKTA